MPPQSPDVRPPRKPGEWTEETTARLHEGLGPEMDLIAEVVGPPLRLMLVTTLRAAAFVVMSVATLWLAFAILRLLGVWAMLTSPPSPRDPMWNVPVEPR